MGNASCVDRLAECPGSRRETPPFLAPNNAEAAYVFDFTQNTPLWVGAAQPLQPNLGYPLRESEGQTSKWELLREGGHAPSLKICYSGRVYVRCGDDLFSAEGGPSRCTAFRLCTRALQLEDTLCGVNFTLELQSSPPGFFLCPCISLQLTNGEVGLVGDRFGPVQPPQDFLLDFSILDIGGQDVQMDVILRGLTENVIPGSQVALNRHGAWTLRTRLQDYTTFNNSLPYCAFLGASELWAEGPGGSEGSGAFLQNLVVSEEPVLTEHPPVSFKWWAKLEGASDWGRLLFEGLDARSLLHEASFGSEPLVASKAADFWHHKVYDMAVGRVSPRTVPEKLAGEFWLSKQAMNVEPMYLHCQVALAQALESCIMLRFSCAQDVLQSLQLGRARPAAPIPSRGVVFGIEQDPRNARLVRMFIEYRNEIVADMVLCEVFEERDEARSIRVHQEIFDGLDILLFRVTLFRANGDHQVASLKLRNEQLEEGASCGESCFGCAVDQPERETERERERERETEQSARARGVILLPIALPKERENREPETERYMDHGPPEAQSGIRGSLDLLFTPCIHC
ncbi:unnamed protein product [Symbiodinium necroappetens]|uniref:Uncharacterized protein n=1 Tax=Symbiodinium necroappetens TaxID=1628268 RepID=A0A812YXQ0_9DINO|nr:unnamed protein product [Symbiodinium necroappetens]